MVNESVGWMVRAAVNPDESSAPTLPTVVIPVAASGVHVKAIAAAGFVQ